MKIGNYKKLLKQRKINYTPSKLLEPVIILSFTSCQALEITHRKKAYQLTWVIFMNSDTKCTAVTAKYNQLIPLKQQLFWEWNTELQVTKTTRKLEIKYSQVP